MQEYRVAVVGCGYVANGHLESWKKIRQARVVAVSDVNEKLAKRTADLWKIPASFPSLSELIEHSKIDVVDVCTPPHTHADLAVQAMKAGFNVLIEKPMTMTVEDAEKIVECQRVTGVKAGVIHNWLFDTPVIEAISLVKKGLLGEVFSAEIEALNTKHDSMAANSSHWCHRFPGGRFSEMLAHPIYLLRHFLGEIDVASVEVSKIGDYPWMKSDELSCIFRSETGLGRAYASFNSSRDAIFINLYGRKGIMKLELINSTLNFLPGGRPSRYGKGFDSARQATQLLKSTAKNVGKIASGRWMSGHETFIKRYVDSLVRGLTPPVTVEDGLIVVRTLEEVLSLIDKKEREHKRSQARDDGGVYTLK